MLGKELGQAAIGGDDQAAGIPYRLFRRHLVKYLDAAERNRPHGEEVLVGNARAIGMINIIGTAPTGDGCPGTARPLCHRRKRNREHQHGREGRSSGHDSGDVVQHMLRKPLSDGRINTQCDRSDNKNRGAVFVSDFAHIGLDQIVVEACCPSGCFFDDRFPELMAYFSDNTGGGRIRQQPFSSSR